MGLYLAVIPRPAGQFEVLPMAYFEVQGPAGLDGAALAGALENLGHRGLWPGGDLPLEKIGPLPASGVLTLSPFKRSAPSGQPAAEVLLVAVKGPDCGQHLSLTRGSYSIGRGECDLRALDPALSRHHADIVVDQTSIALVHTTSADGRPPPAHDLGPRFLAVGDEFVLGKTTFRLCPVHGRASERPGSPPPEWPPPNSTLHAATATSRPWLTMATAILPLAIGIVLALALGSWIFLAFSALGLVTGGVPATSEIVNRRRVRRNIRQLSAKLVAALDSAAPPVGLCALHSLRAPADDTGARRPATAAIHPLRFGDGSVRPPLEIDPPAYRGPKIEPLPGPIVARVSPGGLGLLAGPSGTLGPVVRSIVLQLAECCRRSGASLVLVGTTDLLPAETRFLPGVRVVSEAADAEPLLEELPPGSVLILMPGLKGADRLVSRAGAADPRLSPSVILTDVARREAADWVLDTTTSTLLLGEQAIPVNLDGISRATLAGVAVAAQPEVPVAAPSAAQTGPITSPGSGSSESAWSASSALALECRIGETIEGQCWLDFVGDGPHVLVTGTTGAGKSELLKSMTMDLMRRYGPDQLAVALLDFKGGSTLGPYAETPHCQSLVTDLTTESGERVLAGLRVELRRRESLFQKANVEDYPRYRRSAPSGSPPLPRLLVIVDEFRILTDELPDAEPELMRIATVGRSLGVHLLLSTQRPQGVVTASMRANINTTISLRLLNAGDSQELLGSTVAAEIPVSAPGTGFIRRAGEFPQSFRSRSVEPQNPRWNIQELGPALQDFATVATIVGASATAMSPAVELAALTADIAAPPMPVSAFAPPLPAELHFIPGRLRRQRPAGAIALGLIDDIDHQRLAPLWWHPQRQRRLAVFAGPGSAAPAALLRTMHSLAREDPERHVYVLDGTGYFSSIATIPRVAGYVCAAEPERVHGLLDAFEGPVDTADEALPPRILLVSGLAGWATAMGASAFAALDDRLAALARTAGRQNSCLVVIGDRDLASSRYHALAEHRLYVRFGLGAETTMGWPKLRNTASLPGRAVWVGPGTSELGAVVQLCTSLPTSAPGDGPAAVLPIRRCLPLPASVPADQLPLARAELGRYVLGVTGPDNHTWEWEPGAVGLVLGGPGSGKTTLINLLAHQLKDRVNVSRHLEPGGPAPAILLLDDVLTLSDAHLATLDAMIRSGTHVIMTARPDRAALLRLPAAARMLPGSAHVLLNPRQASEGDLPGWRLQPHPQQRPGRAVALVNGALAQIQCGQRDEEHFT